METMQANPLIPMNKAVRKSAKKPHYFFLNCLRKTHQFQFPENTNKPFSSEGVLMFSACSARGSTSCKREVAKVSLALLTDPPISSIDNSIINPGHGIMG